MPASSWKKDIRYCKARWSPCSVSSDDRCSCSIAMSLEHCARSYAVFPSTTDWRDSANVVSRPDDSFAHANNGLIRNRAPRGGVSCRPAASLLLNEQQHGFGPQEKPMLYLIELFAGTHSVSRAIRNSSVSRDCGELKVLSVDIDPKYDASITTDINRWKFQEDMDEFLRKRRRGDIIFVHASPPCTEFSRALTTRPRNLPAGSRNVKTALRIIAHVVGSYAEPVFWTIENPVGLLQHQPFMRRFDKQKHTTSYCRWGSAFKYRKNTNIWSNLDLDLPICNVHTPCQSKRRYGRHLRTAQSGDSSGGSVGSGGGENVYGLPPKLVRHLIRAAIEQADVN